MLTNGNDYRQAVGGRQNPSFVDDAAAARVVPAMTAEPLNADLPRPHTALCLVTSHDATAHQRRHERHSAHDVGVI